MNKNKATTCLLITICLLISILLTFWILPSIYDKNCQNRVYKDLEKQVNTAKKSIIGIIPEKEEQEGKKHDGFGSGVIFAKEENTYYALTAAHVVDDKNQNYKIFTINTKFSGKKVEIDQDVSFEIPDDNYYKSLIDGKIEYISTDTDLAIISFKSNEELPIIEFSNEKIKINQRIVAIGHPEGNKYVATYGVIKTNNISSKTKDKKERETVIGHNAYLKQGNSGGAALNENMKLIGINISGDFSLLGYFKRGYMIPHNIVSNNIKIWQSKRSNKNITSWTDKKVNIKLKNISQDKKSAILIIEDLNAEPISWGSSFAIQKKSPGDNKWYDLNANTKIEWLRKLYTPNEKGNTIIELDWSKIYGELKKGTYRIVKYNGIITVYSEPFQIK